MVVTPVPRFRGRQQSGTSAWGPDVAWGEVMGLQDMAAEANSRRAQTNIQTPTGGGSASRPRPPADTTMSLRDVESIIDDGQPITVGGAPNSYLNPETFTPPTGSNFPVGEEGQRYFDQPFTSRIDNAGVGGADQDFLHGGMLQGAMDQAMADFMNTPDEDAAARTLRRQLADLGLMRERTDEDWAYTLASLGLDRSDLDRALSQDNRSLSESERQLGAEYLHQQAQFELQERVLQASYEAAMTALREGQVNAEAMYGVFEEIRADAKQSWAEAEAMARGISTEEMVAMVNQQVEAVGLAVDEQTNAIYNSSSTDLSDAAREAIALIAGGRASFDEMVAETSGQVDVTELQNFADILAASTQEQGALAEFRLEGQQSIYEGVERLRERDAQQAVDDILFQNEALGLSRQGAALDFENAQADIDLNRLFTDENYTGGVNRLSLRNATAWKDYQRALDDIGLGEFRTFQDLQDAMVSDNRTFEEFAQEFTSMTAMNVLDQYTSELLPFNRAQQVNNWVLGKIETGEFASGNEFYAWATNPETQADATNDPSADPVAALILGNPELIEGVRDSMTAYKYAEEDAGTLWNNLRANTASNTEVLYDRSQLEFHDGHGVHWTAHQPLLDMIDAAREDGVILNLSDGYRSPETQDAAYAKFIETFNPSTGLGQNLNDEWVPNILPASESKHTTGTAVDFRLAGRSHEWLTNNASQYGWYPISNEKWHWEYRG